MIGRSRIDTGKVPLLIGLLSALIIAACGGPTSVPGTDRPVIRPQDFALVPCGTASPTEPCALAIAGGKRVLFGAPAGAATSLDAEDLKLLDAVLLFSLRAGDIEGLDEIRNASWKAGRSEPLLVVGPEGTDQFVEALNRAYEQADAIRIVEEGIPPGGYDAAVLRAEALPPRRPGLAPVFDTGDLLVEAATGPAGHAVYTLRYLQIVALAGCGGDVQLSDHGDPQSSVTVTCDETGTYRWPLPNTIIMIGND